MVKLDFPRYDGRDDPTTWIRRANKYFQLHDIAKLDKVTLASFLLEELIKLRQIGFVVDYQCKFERLLAKIGLLAPEKKNDVEMEIDDEIKEVAPEISLHAIMGVQAPKTMQVHGELRGQSVIALFHFESTHNFINSRVAQVVELQPNSNWRLEVTVASSYDVVLAEATWKSESAIKEHFTEASLESDCLRRMELMQLFSTWMLDEVFDEVLKIKSTHVGLSEAV
ncbi:hypothetical protein JRO89_XS04G0276900 [Xanthoceras sorbifolium]|uniref:Uncharacterized protein n=1 Tax=Xanthoceras sorbifolium TaxID=99658 RepID=A0ABQ8I822_9ROSI|nr:hypothetical protein JRO89_XS04G0276900 [Xanthoceras sorbifolium]